MSANRGGIGEPIGVPEICKLILLLTVKYVFSKRNLVQFIISSYGILHLL